MADNVNLDGATRIAYADTKHLNRPRWSELSVWRLAEPTPDGRKWVGLSVGMSSRPGEQPLTDTLVTFSLERALELFDESQIGRSVRAQARDWAEHNPEEDAPDGEAFPAAAFPHAAAARAEQAKGFTGTTDEQALDWLFGPDVSQRRRADALNMGESTLRMALRNRTEVRVPLQLAARYFDRERFLADLARA